MSIDLGKMPKLGFGLMRLPMIGDEIDIEQVKRMVDRFLASGLNYFDTAYPYHSGRSEVVAGEALVSRHPRDSFYLASKLPAWELKSEEDRDRIFNEQMRRCQVEYFDFYLLHSIEEGPNYENYVKYNCFDWAMQKKAEGKIRHFGFSFHGSPELLEQVLDEHPEVEFVQIQLNYADWDNPIVCSGKLYNILHERHIPMVIMEPVKGGNLASLIPVLEEKYRAIRPDKSIASWALRFVGSLDGVMTILSGMSSEEQINDNISTFTNFEPLSEDEKKAVDEVRTAMLSAELIGCTGCRYCVDGCPAGISIPDVFRAVNTQKLYPNDSFRPKAFYKGLIGAGKTAPVEECLQCGQCEGACPQHLPIIELLQEAGGRLN